jgi:hypothetical protein
MAGDLDLARTRGLQRRLNGDDALVANADVMIAPAVGKRRVPQDEVHCRFLQSVVEP